MKTFDSFNGNPVPAFKPCLSGLKGLTRGELKLFFQLKADNFISSAEDQLEMAKLYPI